MRDRFPLLRSVLPATALAVAVLLSCPVGASAQLSPADSAAVLLATALELDREGDRTTAEILYRRIVTRFAGTPAAREAASLLDAATASRPEPISRTELQVFGAGYGLWSGIAVPLALGADSPEAVGVGLLLGGPVGLIAARAYLGANPVTEGQARAVSWGGIWGTWQGMGWTGALDIGEGQTCGPFGCFDDGNETAVWAGGVLGGLAGLVTGGVLANRPIRSGVSSGAQGGAIWGSVWGWLAAETFGVDDGDAILATSLLVGNAGLLTGALVASRKGWSRSEVRLLSLGPLVGTLGGVGLGLIFRPDDPEAPYGLILGSGLAGLAVAAASVGRGGSGSESLSPGDIEEGSLLSFAGGRFGVGAPLPTPTVVEAVGPTGRIALRPAIALRLFSARFH